MNKIKIIGNWEVDSWRWGRELGGGWKWKG